MTKLLTDIFTKLALEPISTGSVNCASYWPGTTNEGTGGLFRSSTKGTIDNVTTFKALDGYWHRVGGTRSIDDAGAVGSTSQFYLFQNPVTNYAPNLSLSSKFSTLAAAQAWYPGARLTSLTDSLAWAATQHSLTVGETTIGKGVYWFNRAIEYFTGATLTGLGIEKTYLIFTSKNAFKPRRSLNGSTAQDEIYKRNVQIRGLCCIGTAVPVANNSDVQTAGNTVAFDESGSGFYLPRRNPDMTTAEAQDATPLFYDSNLYQLKFDRFAGHGISVPNGFNYRITECTANNNKGFGLHYIDGNSVKFANNYVGKGNSRGGYWAEGGRVRDKLRDGVEKSIEQLANGFLQHPKNEALRQRVASGEILATEYYRQLLMLIYRLLFLMVAESRDLLLNDHETDLEQRRIYEAYYSIEKLRLLAESPSLRREGFQDLWRGLMVTFQLFDEHWRGQALGLSPLNGDLFGSKALSYIDGYAIDNYDLLTAIKNLSRYDHVSAKGQAAQSRRVNYESLDVEELGSIYESLLDFHPQISVKNAGYEFELVKGSDRKSTGSYYTPPELAAQLIKTALEPVIADKLAGLSSIAEREAALLSITVCDPSCGSGHFLLAAARRLGKELARVRTEEHQPGMEALRPAVRDVIQRCIYGVDLNPLAIDLCKVALWIEGYNKNRPLSFLDHRIKCGNSLVGVLDLDCLAEGIPDGAFTAVTGDDKSLVTKLKKRNKDELKDIDQRCLWDLEVVRAGRVSYALSAEQVGDIEEVTAQDVRSKQESYLRGRSDAVWLRDYTLCNVWTAAFFTPLLEQQLGVIPTTAVLFSLMAGSSVFQKVAEAANALAAEKSFFHWCLEFPEVFQDGGFSCVLGNPPWEMLQIAKKEFFAARDAEIANAQNSSIRECLIQNLSQDNPELLQDFETAKYDADAQNRFIRESDRFALTAVGKINTYSIFSETARKLISPDGRAGIIVPTGIATDDTCKKFFGDLVQRQNLATLMDFENRDGLFIGIDRQIKFSLLTTTNQPTPATKFSFFLTHPRQLENKHRIFTLTPQDISLINPNTFTSPVFRTSVDAELTRKIYQRVPVLENESTGVNPWGISFRQGLFNMSSDSGLFHDQPSSNTLPLYEAKMLHQFDHRWATYEDIDVRDVLLAEKKDLNFVTTPRYWVDKQEVNNRLADKWDKLWLLAFRGITKAVNERTAIFTLLPRVALGHSAPVMIPEISKPDLVACLQANLSSLVFDFVTRQKAGGTNFNFFIVKQLPVLAPESYTPQDIEFISRRVLELVYTAWDMQPFAQDMGYEGAPFVWNPERRALLRAELDAKYAKLYGLTREELRYILDPSDIYGAEFPSETFRVLKNKELKEHGEYRTQRLVLAAWDLLESGGRSNKR